MNKFKSTLLLLVAMCCMLGTAFGYWDNTLGDFNTYSDYTGFAYESYASLPVPTTSHVSSFQGRGCLKLAFSTATQGVKITPFSRFTTGADDQWYLLRIVYYRDTSLNMTHFLPYVLLYDNASTYDIKQIDGTITAESKILPGNWIQFDNYVKCKTTNGHIQLAVKNNGTPGNFYIDSIELTPATPPALINYTNVTIEQGDFNTYSDMSGWSFAPADVNNAPSCTWDSANQRLALTFSNSSQGVKVTSAGTFSIVSGRNAVMSYDINIAASSASAVDCSSFLYADGLTWPYDIGNNVLCGVIPVNQNYMVYVSLSSQDYVTNVRVPQFYIKSNTNSQITVYIDNVQLKYANY